MFTGTAKLYGWMKTLDTAKPIDVRRSTTRRYVPAGTSRYECLRCTASPGRKRDAGDETIELNRNKYRGRCY